MPYDPNRHHRRSIRLRGYDYRQPGAYFVTICTYGRQQLFDDPARRQITEQQWRALARAGERGKVGGRVALDAWVVMPDHIHGIIVITTPNDDPADRAGFVDDGESVGAQQGPSFSDAGVMYDDIAKSKPAFSTDAPAAPLHRGGADAHADTQRHRGGADAHADTQRRHGDADADAHADALHGSRDNVAPGSLGAIVRSYKAAVSRRINTLHHIGPIWQRGYWERVVRDDRELNAVRQYIAANPARWAAHCDDLDALLARTERRDR